MTSRCVVDQQRLHFGGSTFDREKDGVRLSRQLRTVQWLMRDGSWRTLGRIAAVLEFPEASVSARLRDLRKHGYSVERRRVEHAKGLWEYRVVES